MKVLAPAKINIFLEVKGKRPDGYHELCTLMVPLAFCDEITLDPSPSGITLEAAGCGCSAEENLAYRAAELFFASTGISSGVSVTIDKRIPFGAGLGGGSSDAASVLVALNDLFKAGLSRGRLASLAGAIGADCPFFIYGAPMLMGSRGDVPICEAALEDRSYLIVIPPFSVSTGLIFTRLNLPLTQGRDRIKIESIRDRCISPEHWVANDLEPLACNIYPELTRIKGELLSSGALKAGMSGSGSAFFGIFASEAHLYSAMSRLTRHEGYSYIPTTRLTGGIYGDYRGQGIPGKG